MRYALSSPAERYLERRIGPGVPQEDVCLAEISPPPSRLPDHPLVERVPETRVRYSRGESFPDLLALRSGRIEAFPDGVAFPTEETEVLDLLSHARRIGARVIPWGGGTSVVGGVNPGLDEHPTLTVSLERMGRLRDLDEESMLATFESGVRGPWLEAQLRGWGYTLGHFPQSFEYSTLGGWVATRSSGQQSLHYGRIEDLFRGGRLLTPEGPMDLPPFPASAAGPDLRHVVLGSEGRLGLITEVQVRVHPLPEEERFWGIVFPGWEDGIEAVRIMAQDPRPLSMLRLSDAEETNSLLHQALNPYVRRLLEGLLARRGLREEKSLLILGATGDSRTVRGARARAAEISKARKGVAIGDVAGREWRNNRFRVPYLRNTLWEKGWAVDTLETATVWSAVVPTARDVLRALRSTLDGERVLAMAHLSHVYPTGASLYFTFFFWLAADPESTLERWRALKAAASRAIVARGATISHQHGVGADHLPYLEKEKGARGVAMLEALARAVDPDATMNPGKLIPNPSDPL
ncbi:MAG TPA: FAD-binding oxidoreductase [Rubrobacteraceae bacterium]|nr:FAD-binding oxidoreductase [Rubrobacteraceae bacterium]